MVKDGYAWHYKKYQKEQSPDDRLSYAVAENNARTQEGKRQSGNYEGRPPKLSYEQKSLVKSEFKARISKVKLSNKYGVNRATILRIVNMV